MSCIADHFETQARACADLGSPFTAALCRAIPAALDTGTETGRHVLGWEGDARADALALRFCGGLHALVLTDSDRHLATLYPPNALDEDALRETLADAIRRHDAFLLNALESAPQTNEIARSAMLLPGFLEIARQTGLPLSINEIGTSGGLNLLFDKFHYRYGKTEWGDPASPVRLSPSNDGKPFDPSGDLSVIARSGCDIAPIDVSKDDDRLRLRSYIWPDQPERLERLDAAISLMDSADIHLERADAAAFVKERLATRQKGTTFVLFHSIMWQYMPAETQVEIEALLFEAGAAAASDDPIAWLRMEPGVNAERFADLSVTQWPGGETKHLAECNYHGRWLRLL